MNNLGFLFDLDGVIINSETEYTRIWEIIDSKFPTGVPDFAHVIKGTTLDNILSTYFRPEDFDEIIANLYDLEGKMNYNYCPGARELLDTLAARDIPMALVTSSNKDKMSHLYEQHPEIQDIFSFIVTADAITRSKPDPEGYLLGARSIGIDPKRCIVVEDSVQGMRAGHAAGARVVGMSGTVGERLTEPECDIMLSSLIDFPLDDVLNLINV